MDLMRAATREHEPGGFDVDAHALELWAYRGSVRIGPQDDHDDENPCARRRKIDRA